jgi:hypothetical protein
MGRLRARWLGVAFILLVLSVAGLLLGLGIYLRSRGLDRDAKLSEVASAAVPVLAAVLGGLGKVVRWLPAPKLKDEQVDSDVADLAAAPADSGPARGRTAWFGGP